MKINSIIGRHYDLTTPSAPSLQSEPLIGKTIIQYAEGLPSVVLKYKDSAGTILVFTTNITWANGVPSVVVTVNNYTGVTATTTLSWANGLLESATKILT